MITNTSSKNSHFRISVSPLPFRALTDPLDEDEENGEIDSSAGRFVRYQFTPAFLKLRTVGATWVLSTVVFEMPILFLHSHTHSHSHLNIWPTSAYLQYLLSCIVFLSRFLSVCHLSCPDSPVLSHWLVTCLSVFYFVMSCISVFACHMSPNSNVAEWWM